MKNTLQEFIEEIEAERRSMGLREESVFDLTDCHTKMIYERAFEKVKVKIWNEAVYCCVDISSVSTDKREMLNGLKED